MGFKPGPGFIELENEFIPLEDGRRLAARIWLPPDADSSPVPAILEYLPYRKRDGTAQRDDATYPAFARAGYAGVRVDISGTGESDGDFDDEYSAREHADALQVIDWIAAQSWCTGRVGMMGISWGGFNSLQLAALGPAPLKAVIAIGATVDRYNDDIHYKNGCHLYSNFSWSNTMLCFASRPPDPLLVGGRWRESWKHRLKTQPFPLETWLSHQRRDEYWKHGSVCEDYAAIAVPSMVIGGFSDGYTNAPPAMAAHGGALSRAVNGPWIHKYPHFALPRPRMNFHAEAIRWWDRWLKDVDNGMERLPAYRAYLSENVRPGRYRDHEAGRWVAERDWPSANVTHRALYPSSRHGLADTAQREGLARICSPQDCGVACGEFFTLKPDSELSADQRIDDAGSLTFRTEPLREPLDILGRPILSAVVSIDKPLGNVAARLVDVHPDGSGHRVSWGVLNLAHRRGNEHPEPMTPGREERVEIVLDECGYRFLAGHRVQLSIATAYWPMIMPPPETVTATVRLGAHTRLVLPVRADDDGIEVPEPDDPDPLPPYVRHTPPDYRRVVEKDLQENLTRYRVYDDTGEYEAPGHGMRTRHVHEACWSIAPDDPLTATATGAYVCHMSRGDWRIRTVSESRLACDAQRFHLYASVTAWEGERLFNRRTWERTIARDRL